MNDVDRKLLRGLANVLLKHTDDPKADAETCARACIQIGQLVLIDLKHEAPPAREELTANAGE